MKIKSNQITIMALVVCFATLFGCGDKSEPQSQAAESNAVSLPVQPALAPLEPRYEATLAQGIEFKKNGYPTFLAEVSGMSGQEDWGRWTEAAAGSVARFRFKQTLPQKFIIEITANAFGPNEGQPIRVRVGAVEKTFVIPSGTKAGTYSLTFESTNGVDTIEIVPPMPTSPAELKVSADTRKLGIGLVSLKIR